MDIATLITTSIDILATLWSTNTVNRKYYNENDGRYTRFELDANLDKKRQCFHMAISLESRTLYTSEG